MAVLALMIVLLPVISQAGTWKKGGVISGEQFVDECQVESDLELLLPEIGRAHV